MVFLLVLILVGGFFVYKFLIQKDESAQVLTDQGMIERAESQPEYPNLDIRAGLELSKTVLVASVPQEGASTIVGEIFEVRQEATFQSTTAMDYAAAFQAMLEEISTDVESKVNIEYAKEGYYVAPAVIEQIEETSLPDEDEYAPGVSLSATIINRLLAIPESAVKTILLDDLSAEQVRQIQDNYNHMLRYELISESVGIDKVTVNLLVTLVLEDK